MRCAVERRDPAGVQARLGTEAAEIGEALRAGGDERRRGPRNRSPGSLERGAAHG